MRKSLYLIIGSIVLLTASVLWADGTIKGSVKFEGKGPRPRPLNMEADPVCAAAHAEPVHAENVIINANSTLKNVLVSIHSEISGSFDIPTEPVVLDQKGCMYSPHVWGIMQGQTLEVRNSDATLHNIHSLSKVNRQFNLAMPKIVKKKEQVFDKVEDVFAIKCDVHPWMRTWGAVFDHPFFAVTDDQGNFEIKNVPDGTYTLRAWHESKRLPAQTMEVTVKGGEVTQADFTFSAVKN